MGTWPDLEQTLTDLINTDWTQSNVDSSRITYINERDEEKRVSMGSQDAILCYMTSTEVREVGILRKHVDRIDKGTIEVMTVGGRTIIQKICKEVERIMYANYQNPTTKPSGASYSVLRPLGWVRIIDGANLWRYGLNVEALAHWESR